jgi:NAD-reducing hydrogenase small subunit
MSFLDLDETLIELADSIELTATPITDIKSFTPVDLGILEGAIGNQHDEQVTRDLRANCRVLMALGDCACFGGIAAMRNLFPTKAVLKRYYSTESTTEGEPPTSEELPPLTKVRAVHEVVTVDCYVPGCPPTAATIKYALTELLAGRVPVLAAEMLRFD